MLPNLGFQELTLIFLIVLVIFGARKLPLLGKGLGEGIRNFKRGLQGKDAAEQLDEGQAAEDQKSSS
jgi:sec-independent protein translocase protein TatA